MRLAGCVVAPPLSGRWCLAAVVGCTAALAVVLAGCAAKSQTELRLKHFTETVLEIETHREELIRPHAALSPTEVQARAERLLYGHAGGRGLLELRARMLEVTAPAELSAVKNLLVQAYALEIAAARDREQNLYLNVNPGNVWQYLDTRIGGGDWVQAQELRAQAWRQCGTVLAQAGLARPQLPWPIPTPGPPSPTPAP